MKLKELKDILKSDHHDIQFAIVYDTNLLKDVENGCSLEYAVLHYGERTIERIMADDNKVVLCIA